MRAVILILALALTPAASAEPPAPVWIEYSVPELVAAGEGEGPALFSVVDVFNTTDEVQPAWSGTIQWLHGKPGVILCSVEVSLDEPLHENWPSEARLTLSRATPCQSGVLTETTDVDRYILALDPVDVWLRSWTNPLDRVRQPSVERRPSESVLMPSVVERVLGGNPQVMDCFEQAFEDG